MPEGPECKRIGESLAKVIATKTISNVEILSGRYTENVPTGLDIFESKLPIAVVGVGVHGKFIYWILRDGWSLWNTLGMTGSWGAVERKHSRVKFSFSDGTQIYFNDPRNFGTLKFVYGKHHLIEKLQSLGPDLLSQKISDEDFAACLRKKQTAQITSAIMNQSIVAGVGNYVKAEALWLAKINPHKHVRELSFEELSKLNQAIQRVLEESYESGGATIKTYKNFNGENGDYSRKFMVYNQKTDPEGNEVVREMTADNRTTHWVPAVQK